MAHQPVTRNYKGKPLPGVCPSNVKKTAYARITPHLLTILTAKDHELAHELAQRIIFRALDDERSDAKEYCRMILERADGLLTREVAVTSVERIKIVELPGEKTDGLARLAAHEVREVSGGPP